MSIEATILLAQGDQVRHDRFGLGKVELDKGMSVIARFAHGFEECPKAALSQVETALQALVSENWHNPLEVITRVQAEIIESINDAWGIFSPARIALLPHQLWVCKRVLERWPTRWLVADDVGLGKTIEAGLILWPLLASGRVQRLLIICPASLAPQWQNRMLSMFDIPLTLYSSDVDTERTSFWDLHKNVIVSLQTIRKDNHGRHERLIESDPWDLLIVDEAHHLNADEEQGPTLGYRLVKRLVEEQRVRSMVFFTGTPHRGKNFGFLSLMQLLRPELFNPKERIETQLPRLAEVMIRNNKQNVTDLKGARLFQQPFVISETYRYSPDEACFYEMLTDFIASGKAYASTLSAQDGRAVVLVLIAMQKLASSSVAAIRRALKGRLARIEANRKQLDRLRRQRSDMAAALGALRRLDDFYQDRTVGDAEIDTDDLLNQKEEEILHLAAAVKLMEDEEPRLVELVRVANLVLEETKMRRISQILRETFIDQTVLFFTEYKATQSLLMSVLQRDFGDGCVSFINGDARAEDVFNRAGHSHVLRESRESAAERFNTGQVRFLVSTEAGGEGIDLQEKCHCMIHVDLPWNPMRLHQRVGRLNRYGQQFPVQVITLRNPETVESRIWEKLTGKLNEIMRAFGNVMDEPEDLMQLVLGMTSPSLFLELFTEAPSVPHERLSSWFDHKTARFGGTDVISTVKDLVGHSSRFDYQQVSSELPRLDLPDLKPFVVSMLTLNGRRVTDEDGQLSFKTPEAWLQNEPGIRENYDGMIFSREDRSRNAARRILGVGHKVVDKALTWARKSKASIANVPIEVLEHPLFIFRIIDQITSEATRIRSLVIGAYLKPDREDWEIIRDSDLLLELNRICIERGIRSGRSAGMPIGAEQRDNLKTQAKGAEKFVKIILEKLAIGFQLPEANLLTIVTPVDRGKASCED